jgi:hypothetical protein
VNFISASKLNKMGRMAMLFTTGRLIGLKKSLDDNFNGDDQLRGVVQHTRGLVAEKVRRREVRAKARRETEVRQRATHVGFGDDERLR